MDENKLESIIFGLKQENAEQKAEIERLTREKTESAKTAVEVIEQNLELQKQVDELKEQNAQLSEMADYDKGHKEGYEHGAKTTAKEICDLILEHWEKKQFVECDWLRVAIAEKYGVEVE